MKLSKDYFMRAEKLALLGFVLYLGGCIPNKGYRTQLPVQVPNQLPECPPVGGATPPACSIQIVRAGIGDPPKPVEIPLAFIEFDDEGQAFERGQINAAEAMIQAQRQKYSEIVTILFIHGWKNNASDESGNVAGFRRFLQQFQPTLASSTSGTVGLVGVYFGWRGGTTNLAVVKDLTYWNRRDTATYIPGSNMSEALLRVARATKGPDYGGDSKLVVVGHSFGGLVLERTVTQYLTRRLVENPSGIFKPFADLLVFVNEAAAATEAIQLLTMLRERYPERPLYPTIVSITSQGDLATKLILPVGQGASLFKKSLRDYGPPYDTDPFGIAKQRTYYLRSATHIPQLQSHVVGNSADILTAYRQHGYTCASIRSLTGGKNTNYYVVPIAGAKNTTPYWIMEMPVEIVPDHSNIFRLQFATLLQAFVLRQAQEDPNQRPDENGCYTEPSTAPRIDMRLMRNTFSAR
jgi:hypothetical protein